MLYLIKYRKSEVNLYTFNKTKHHYNHPISSYYEIINSKDLEALRILLELDAKPKPVPV